MSMSPSLLDVCTYATMDTIWTTLEVSWLLGCPHFIQYKELSYTKLLTRVHNQRAVITTLLSDHKSLLAYR